MLLTEVLNGRKQLFPAKFTTSNRYSGRVKVVPLIPGPLNVPPTGEPVSVAAAAVDWYVAESPEKDTLGTVFIVAITGMRLL